jgi:hypothetical protein
MASGISHCRVEEEILFNLPFCIMSRGVDYGWPPEDDIAQSSQQGREEEAATTAEVGM